VYSPCERKHKADLPLTRWSCTHTRPRKRRMRSVRSDVRSGISCEICMGCLSNATLQCRATKTYATLSRSSASHITSIPPSNPTGNLHRPSVPCVFQPTLTTRISPIGKRRLVAQITPASARSSRFVPFSSSQVALQGSTPGC
jgi:hypothetical protein